ncbi:MAG: tRNA guanosine(34) transglycosylase Tgt [Elusimicrobiota bacterium]
MSFKVLAKDKDGKARSGVLSTGHGDVETPVFMPVATQASVKAISQEDLERLGTKAILSNSYHLYLRPGTDLIKAAGGLHKFMDYKGMILTDSGGFQVLSMSDLRKVDDEGVTFRSHIDGSEHRLTAEKVIEIQSDLGSDCWTTLDECPPYPSTEAQAEQALNRTMTWTDRSVTALNRAKDAGHKPLFFPILQGGFFPDLRKRAVEHLQEKVPWDGVSIGGFSIGEPKDLTWSTLDGAISHMPADKPRYLMGVGTPDDVWQAVSLGVDMMDCVWPTRVARNGQIMTRRGKFNIQNAPQRRKFEPLDADCACFVCKRYTRAYLSHLYRARELVIYQLLSYHNLHFMDEIMAIMRTALAEGNFAERRKAFFEVYNAGQ